RPSRSLSAPSPCPPSTIDVENRSRHVRCRRRGQKDNRSQQFSWPPQTPHRRKQFHARALLVVHAPQRRIGNHFGGKPGRRQGVDGNPIRRPFDSQLACHIGHRSFGGGIANGFVDCVGPFAED